MDFEAALSDFFVTLEFVLFLFVDADLVYLADFFGGIFAEQIRTLAVFKQIRILTIYKQSQRANAPNCHLPFIVSVKLIHVYWYSRCTTVNYNGGKGDEQISEGCYDQNMLNSNNEGMHDCFNLEYILFIF